MLRILGLTVLLLSATVAHAAERRVTLAVENMTCAACPITVRTAIERVPGVRDVEVDFENKTAAVLFDDSQATIEALEEASRLAGYPAHRME